MSGSLVLPALPWSVTSELCKDKVVLVGSTVPSEARSYMGSPSQSLSSPLVKNVFIVAPAVVRDLPGSLHMLLPCPEGYQRY